MATFASGPEKWTITGRRHLLQILGKLIIAYGSCQIISAFYFLCPPEFPSENPFTPPLGSQNKQLMLNVAGAATHQCVYLAEERRRRLCRPISTVTPSTVWNCHCNSLNTWMRGGAGGESGAEWRGGFMEKIAHLFPGCCRTARLHRVPQITKWRCRRKGRARQRRQRAGKRHGENRSLERKRSLVSAFDK